MSDSRFSLHPLLAPRSSDRAARHRLCFVHPARVASSALRSATMAYGRNFALPPEVGSGAPGAPPALPDPPTVLARRVKGPSAVSVDDHIDVLGVEVVLGSRRSIEFSVDPHTLYRSVCLLCTGGLWLSDGRPGFNLQGKAELREAFWTAMGLLQDRFTESGQPGVLFQGFLEKGKFVPRLLAGVGFVAAGASLLVRANNRFEWFPSLLSGQARGSTQRDWDRYTLTPAALAIADAIHEGSIRPIAQLARADGAAEIYPRVPVTGEFGAEAIDVSRFGYSQFVLKTGRRPAKVVRPEDHHKRGRAYATSSQNVVSLLNSLLVDMRAICVMRGRSPSERVIPGFYTIWKTWNDPTTRLEILSQIGFKGSATRVVYPAWDTNPQEYIDSPGVELAIEMGRALIAADWRPPPEGSDPVPGQDGLAGPSFHDINTHDSFEHAQDFVEDPENPGTITGGSALLGPPMPGRKGPSTS